MTKIRTAVRYVKPEWTTVRFMPDAELPLLSGGVTRERADAARNRIKVLAAAEELFAAHGIAEVSMDDVATAAGVGKGTLYRRFGDKSGLAAALLNERESELQSALLSGPPPLGPGAPPDDRLAAFTSAYLAYVDKHLDLVAMSQTASPDARLRIGAHQLWQQHCRILLTAAGVADPDVRADTLLAALTAEQVRHWRRTQKRPLSALTDALVAISRRLADGG
jgi:AcrR family transcriptional regulator